MSADEKEPGMFQGLKKSTNKLLLEQMAPGKWGGAVRNETRSQCPARTKPCRPWLGMQIFVLHIKTKLKQKHRKELNWGMSIEWKVGYKLGGSVVPGTADTTFDLGKHLVAKHLEKSTC